MTNEELAEVLAQAALRGWFGDPVGFKNMREKLNRQAVKSVLQVLNELQPPAAPIHEPPSTESKGNEEHVHGLCGPGT